ncbi:HotDog domain-containing protein [Fusarium acuminatum]|uniref:HotDog domain-containing protein n=1 Tax=Fusarium acuminatum TaxID=5515 RepID=A0ABZ2X9A0_9HYPO
MMSKSQKATSIISSLRRSHAIRSLRPALAKPTTNSFHTSAARQTDGVFHGLEDKRQPMPWIEAFTRQQQGLPAHDTSDTAKERDLTPKKMSDSYHRVVLPLKKDPWLLGTLFMDLDALSGIIVYKHTGPGVTTVTAALDRITIAHPLTEICDLEYSGQVTYASGRSSVEITCKVAKAREEGEPSKPEDVLLTCTFTMVALDPNTRKPVAIPRLEPTNEEEEKIFKAGEQKSLAKKDISKVSLLQTEPNDAESALIHQIWLRQLAYHDPNNQLRQPSNVVAMSKTQLSTANIMQPQFRNRHQTMIFGGFHLKQTFELAFCCAASFAHARPTFISADPCTFRNPVPVGSVLYLTATVAYTDPPLLEEDGTEPGFPDPKNPMTRVHIRVDSKVRDVEHGVAKPTGQFNYTFSVPKNLKVLPHTYEEYMVYIDARRRVSLGDSQRKEESKAFSEKRPEASGDVNLVG